MTEHRAEPYTHSQIDVTVRLGALTRASQTLVQEMRDTVDEARGEGMSWAKIGLALGVSTQAAWDRFSGHQRDSEVPLQEQLIRLNKDGGWRDFSQEPEREEQPKQKRRKD